MATTGKKGGSNMIWIIGGIILIAGGVGAYFMFRKPKEGTNKKNDSITKGDETKTITDNTSVTNTSGTNVTNTSGTNVTNTGGTNVTNTSGTNVTNTSGTNVTNTGGSTKIVAPEELNTKTKIRNFQKYVINTKKDNRILGRFGADGIYGKNTDNAWKKYGADFISTNTSSAFSNFESGLDLDI